MGRSRIGHEDHFGTPLVRALEVYVRNPGSVRPIDITPGLSECNCMSVFLVWRLSPHSPPPRPRSPPRQIPPAALRAKGLDRRPRRRRAARRHRCCQGRGRRSRRHRAPCASIAPAVAQVGQPDPEDPRSSRPRPAAQRRAGHRRASTAFGTGFHGVPSAKLVVYAREVQPTLAYEVVMKGFKADRQTPTEMRTTSSTSATAKYWTARTWLHSAASVGSAWAMSPSPPTRCDRFPDDRSEPRQWHHARRQERQLPVPELNEAIAMQ